jgi:hypothetical protein
LAAPRKLESTGKAFLVGANSGVLRRNQADPGAVEGVGDGVTICRGVVLFVLEVAVAATGRVRPAAAGVVDVGIGVVDQAGLLPT